MFILSSNKRLEPELSNYDRLYAYPNKPNISENNTIILDSGAFALSFSGRKMDAEYMRKLAMFYEKHKTSDNVYCVSADVFKNPHATMRQHECFSSMCDAEVSPVIQFTSPVVDLFSARKQVLYYKRHSPNLKMICISNHKFNIELNHNHIRRLVKIIKDSWGDSIKIHVLGAGFNSSDVAKWMSTGVTTMDSISYYTDAQAKQKWCFGSSKVEASDLTFKNLALINANIAIKSSLNYEVFL